MHIRQLFVAGVILFGTTLMEAGRKGVKRHRVSHAKLSARDLKKMVRSVEEGVPSKEQKQQLEHAKKRLEKFKLRSKN